MSRVCEICGKRPQSGRALVYRGLAKKKGGVGRKLTGISKRVFKPNIQSVRAVIDGEIRRIKACAACIRSGKVNKPA